jgi:hypothetical protein
MVHFTFSVAQTYKNINERGDKLKYDKQLTIIINSLKYL